MTNRIASFTLSPALLTMDWGDGLPVIPGYVRDGVRWNGWQCPVFDLDVLRAHRADLAELFPAFEGVEAFVWDDNDMPHRWETFEDGTREDAVSIVTLNGREYVDIGSFGYTWEVARARHAHAYRADISDWWCETCDTVTDYCEDASPR